MAYMPTDWEKLINEEKARIIALDSTLDQKRTPWLKGQLRLAMNKLGDARDALAFAAKAEPNYHATWIGFADFNIRAATQAREKVQAAVDTHGGPENVIEIGG